MKRITILAALLSAGLHAQQTQPLYSNGQQQDTYRATTAQLAAASVTWVHKERVGYIGGTVQVEVVFSGTPSAMTTTMTPCMRGANADADPPSGTCGTPITSTSTASNVLITNGPWDYYTLTTTWTGTVTALRYNMTETTARVGPGTGGGAPSGPAGGDLAGTYPNPQVRKSNNFTMTGGSIDNSPIGATTPAAVNATTVATTGMITESAAGTGSIAAGLMGLYQPNLANGNYAGFILGKAATANNAAGIFFIPGASAATTCINLGVYGVQGLQTCGDNSGNFIGTLKAPRFATTATNGTGFNQQLYTPSSSSAACTAGDWADDTNFHYICVATNTWKRSPAAYATF